MTAAEIATALGDALHKSRAWALPLPSWRSFVGEPRRQRWLTTRAVTVRTRVLPFAEVSR
jgi:hypothetical protein